MTDTQRPTCRLEGCEKPVKPRHLTCSMHLARIARHGDPDLTVSYAARAWWCPWTPTPTYSAVHQRLQRVRGRADAHTCACGAPAAQWAYDRTDPAPLRAPWPYSADLRRYVAMCVPCHKRFDLRHQ